MGSDRVIILILTALIGVGLVYVGSVVFLGTLIFAGFWVVARRIPGFEGLAARFPLIVDLATLIGSFVLLASLGVKSMTAFLATAVAGIEVSLWVAVLSLRHARRRQLARGEGVTPSTVARAG
jgi:hypothetical protein